MGIKCGNPCPIGKYNGCCFECPHKKECQDPCIYDPASCENAIFLDESQALTAFRRSQIATLNEISAIITQKKTLEEQEKSLKGILYQAMQACGIKKFESNVLNLTLVAPTLVTSVDSTKLKKKYPEIAAECSKTSEKAGYVKITLKGSEK